LQPRPRVADSSVADRSFGDPRRPGYRLHNIACHHGTIAYAKARQRLERRLRANQQKKYPSPLRQDKGVNQPRHSHIQSVLTIAT
jgi:hypothetical protein